MTSLFMPRAVVRATQAATLSVLMAAMAAPALAQANKLTDLPVYPQIQALMQEKAPRNAAQQKLSSHLVIASAQTQAQSRRGLRADGVDTVANDAVAHVAPDFANRATVDIKGRVSDVLVAEVLRLGGTIGHASPRSGVIRATLPLGALETLAANPAVQQVQPAERFTTNVGALTSQGYVSHRAREAVAAGYTGAGVRVGVLSDSASPARVAALIASGDLPADTVV
ncbi:hypothetical protein WDZ92_47150, partial [Nostoc sp. NIES-2111]